MDSFIKTAALLGEQNLQRLQKAKVAIIGVGGVGSYAVEALARAPIGNLLLVDFDIVAESNINRQLIATSKTVGKLKVEIMKQRCLEINPHINITTIAKPYNKNNADEIFAEKWDYVVDAIDDISAKIHLLQYCIKHKLAIISSMGAANKLDPNKIQIADISKTAYCPLARKVRKELKKIGIEKGIKVVYSNENMHKPTNYLKNSTGKVVAGTISYMPACFGLHCAAVVIQELINNL